MPYLTASPAGHREPRTKNVVLIPFLPFQSPFFPYLDLRSKKKKNCSNVKKDSTDFFQDFFLAEPFSVLFLMEIFWEEKSPFLEDAFHFCQSGFYALMSIFCLFLGN